MKEYEQRIQPLMTKMYAGKSDGGADDSVPTGPKVEEVD
jgi:hypothetical protein